MNLATFSVQDPIRGDFVYFEGPSLAAINDDQPVPRFDDSIQTSLGVPSILAGRPMPPGCKETGRGRDAKGYVSTGKLAGRSNFMGGSSGRDPSLGLSGTNFETIANTLEPYVPMLASAAGGLAGLRIAGGAKGATLLVLPAIGAIAGYYIAKNLISY